MALNKMPACYQLLLQGSDFRRAVPEKNISSEAVCSKTPVSRGRSKKILPEVVSSKTVESVDLVVAEELRKTPSKKQKSLPGRRVTRSLRKQKIDSDVSTPSKHVAEALEQVSYKLIIFDFALLKNQRIIIVPY